MSVCVDPSVSCSCSMVANHQLWFASVCVVCLKFTFSWISRERRDVLSVCVVCVWLQVLVVAVLGGR